MRQGGPAAETPTFCTSSPRPKCQALEAGTSSHSHEAGQGRGSRAAQQRQGSRGAQRGSAPQPAPTKQAACTPPQHTPLDPWSPPTAACATQDAATAGAELRTCSAAMQPDPPAAGTSPRRRGRSGPKSRSSPYLGVSQASDSRGTQCTRGRDAPAAGARGHCRTAGSCARVAGPADPLAPALLPLQYKRTGRWEAHIWDSGEPGSGAKGRQLHLGSFTNPEAASRCARGGALRPGCTAPRHCGVRAGGLPPLSVTHPCASLVTPLSVTHPCASLVTLPRGSPASECHPPVCLPCDASECHPPVCLPCDAPSWLSLVAPQRVRPRGAAATRRRGRA